jgi:hypothetical protein
MIPGTAHSPSIEHVDSCCADSNVPLSICRLAVPKTATSTMGIPTSSTKFYPRFPRKPLSHRPAPHRALVQSIKGPTMLSVFVEDRLGNSRLREKLPRRRRKKSLG